METNVRTPLEIFNLPQHLLIPLFQRPYVWSEDDQWAPLWHDVRRMAELRIRDRYSSASHFLGAVVLQALENATGNVSARNIIDGQQRLTTLQLLTDAAAAAFESSGLDNLSSQLANLTHNDARYVPDASEQLKLRHANKDRAAFREVMNADVPVDHASLVHGSSRLAGAHRYFLGEVSAWLQETEEPELASRAEALADVLNRGLQLVVIDLKPHEDSQEIFETLNARGTPLTAADLIKNFVFQRLESEGVDTRRAYAEEWPFERKFWETEISVGRYSMSRSSLFFNQWLSSRLGEEVRATSTFTRFKSFVEHDSGQKMSDLLPTIRRQADLYEEWTRAADDPDRDLSRVELAVYRMNASGIELLKPILLWLHEPEAPVPPTAAAAVVQTMESWIMRRQLLRLSSSDGGRVIADVIRLHRNLPPEELPARVEDYMASLRVASTYWPADKELRTSLATERAYRRFPRARLRMFLEAAEDQLRSAYKAGRVSRRGYPIEHLLPQRWETNWPVDTVEEELSRNAHVHVLGNLTLLTESLNSSVSNAAWLGETGKRAKLRKYDVLLLNRTILDSSEDGWDEAHIDARTGELVDLLLAVWPVPAGHEGVIHEVQSPDKSWIEIRHLVGGGLLAVGTRLRPRKGPWPATEAVVTQEGNLLVEGHVFQSPSGAARRVKGAVANGWMFWLLEDGRRLDDVRSLYRGERPATTDDSYLSWTAEDVEDAQAVWSGMSEQARQLFLTLIDVAPSPMTTPEIVDLLGLPGSSSVPALLSWPTRLAIRAGNHHPPIQRIEGALGSYWMDETTAELFARVAADREATDGLDEPLNA